MLSDHSQKNIKKNLKKSKKQQIWDISIITNWTKPFFNTFFNVTLVVNQTRYEQIRVVDCTLDHWSLDAMTMILKRNSSRNDGIYNVTEKFFKTLKNKCYKHLTGVWKNVHIDKLDEKLADVKSGTYIVYDVEHNGKDPNSKLVIMWKS